MSNIIMRFQNNLFSLKSKIYQDAVDLDSTNPFQLSIEQYFNPREYPGKGFIEASFIIYYFAYLGLVI